LAEAIGVYRQMWLVRLAICAGFLLIGYAQFRLSDDMVRQQRDFDSRVPFALTPFSNRIAIATSWGPQPDDRLLLLNGEPYTGMHRYLWRYWDVVRLYDTPGAKEFAVTVESGGRTAMFVLPRKHCTCGIPSRIWAISIWAAPPFFCILTAWFGVMRHPRSPLAWAFAGTLLSLSQISLWPELGPLFDLIGSPMGWPDGARVPVVAGRAFLQSAWPAFVLAGAGTIRPLGCLGWGLMVGFLGMAGMEAGLAVAWSEDYRPWVGLHEVLAARGTELALVGMGGVALWVWRVDRWLGVVAGLIWLGAGVALYMGPETLDSFRWVHYSDDRRKVEPDLPPYVVTPQFVVLVAMAAMLLAALARAGSRVPWQLVGAWTLTVPLLFHLARAWSGYWIAFQIPFLEDWPEFFLWSAAGAVQLAGGWVLERARN
jgi:hypothetical protein